MKKLLQNKKGQTTVEWILLTGVAFITAYFMITGPLATFTSRMITQIRNVTGNIVRNGEMEPNAAPPASPQRLRAIHL